MVSFNAAALARRHVASALAAVGMLACCRGAACPHRLLHARHFLQDAYRNMLSYSPVDNTAPQRYPHLLLTAGECCANVVCSPLAMVLLAAGFDILVAARCPLHTCRPERPSGVLLGASQVCSQGEYD